MVGSHNYLYIKKRASNYSPNGFAAPTNPDLGK